MSDSETNELDSYGVWVKKTPEENNMSDELDFADSLDLPDFEETENFDDTNFSDMFKDDSEPIPDAADQETTLTSDELLNLTNSDDISLNSFDIPSEEPQVEDPFADFNTSADEPVAEETPSDEPSFEIDEGETPAVEETPSDEPSFEIDEGEEPAVTDSFEDTAAEESVEIDPDSFGTEDVSEDFGITSEGGEEEVSLDDFMDFDSSSDSPSPSASENEEISLDDFLDGGFESDSAAPQKEETFAEEKPISMDISFDNSVDQIETEENIEANIDSDEDDYEEYETETEVKQEETLDSLETRPVEESFDSEEVDLSDFGIDADAEETPVTQDVESEKIKEVVVDYDLNVDNGNMSAAPVVNEIKSSSAEDIAEAEVYEEAEEITDDAEAPVAAVDNSLLQQIVADLSSLKDEINLLKSNLEEMKTAEGEPKASAEDDIIIPDDIPETKDEGGFFSSDDGDDTIALSGDELNNILNTADFNTQEDESTEITEDSSEYVFEDKPLEEPKLDDIEIPTEDELPDEISIPKEDDDFGDILVESSSEDFMNSIQEESSDEEPDNSALIAGAAVAGAAAIGTAAFLASQDDETSETVEEEVVTEEEPAVEESAESDESFEDMFSEEASEEETANDLPDTIEENFGSFEDSVVNPEDTVTDEELKDDTFEGFEGFEEEKTEEPKADEDFNFNSVSDDFENFDAPAEETPAEETSFEETPAEEEPVAEESVADFDIEEESPAITEEEAVTEEPAFDEDTVIQEPFEEEENETAIEPFAEDFVSEEASNNQLSDSNLDYLTEKSEETPAAEEGSFDKNAELKKDIKSVLLYMDQLLENLPNDKIEEFARSEEFGTYKKLFSELGLS